MPLTPSDIIEALVDELAMGQLGQDSDGFTLHREAPGTLVLDYGDEGKFRLEVRADHG